MTYRQVLGGCLLLAAIMSLSLGVWGQTITQPFTPEEYVNDVLLGGGITASNVTFSGGNDQIGLVSNSGAALGLEGGVMLNTDHVSCTSTCTNCGGLQSDADLESVANSVPTLIGQSFTVGSTYDVARLEFDFVADGDSISFDYVFGSDEYLTYVNTQYNDIFAFFLSGPGINGQFTSPPGFPGGAINLAQVPNSDPPLPITISSVNNVTNSQYYVPGNNAFCTNGYTVPFTAEAAVLCGETYHIELVIADCSDNAFESFVMIGEGSFTSEVEVEATVDAGVSGCNGADVDFSFSGELEDASWVWNFGDGTTSLEESPTHFYQEPGTYEVLFIWEGACALDTIALEVQIGALDFDYVVNAPDAIDCTEDGPTIVLQLNSAEGATMSSTDLDLALPSTVGGAVVWEIESGQDGWNVFEIVVDQEGCQQTYVDSILFDPAAEILVNPEYDVFWCSGVSVDFDFTGNLDGAIWLWEFGDGEVSTEESPTYTYTDPGSYEVLLLWQGLCPFDTVSTVLEFEPEEVSFEVSGPEAIDCESTDSEVVVTMDVGTSAAVSSSTLLFSSPSSGSGTTTWNIESGPDGWNFYDVVVTLNDCETVQTDSVFIVSGVEVDYIIEPSVICQGGSGTLTITYSEGVTLSNPIGIGTDFSLWPTLVLDVAASAPGVTVYQIETSFGETSTIDYGFEITASLGGCEAVILDAYTVEPSISIEEFVGCDSVVYEGQTYYETQPDFVTLDVGETGCVTSVINQIQVFESTYDFVDASSCEPIVWEGQFLTESGTYQVVTGTNDDGCPNVLEMTFDLLEATESEVEVTSCDEYEWNGIQFTSSGSYDWMGTNAVGCDSSSTLNLTIAPSWAYDALPIISCEPVDWNGLTLEASGVYLNEEVTTFGCDSIISLQFTLLEPTESTTTVAVFVVFAIVPSGSNGAGNSFCRPKNLSTKHSSIPLP